ncbi:hypothetical protein [Streptomyces galbus]|uniref:Uncharacterized protein n=1 Tax=Streptomyces galbus TaxID=33898 RepID=A0ABX1IRR7_STRGB|nr:hypothetical protein [Streptomyces galbus]NKQ28325.1 hypothetical protein [Streptomyces galbus]
MPTLPRAPRERAAWFWDLYDFHAPGLEPALSLAARLSEVLDRHALLAPVRLEYLWTVSGVGSTGIRTTLDLAGTPLGDPALPDRVRGSRPVAHPTAHVTNVSVLGTGTRIDAEGHSRGEYRLVDLTVSAAPTGLSAELSVHHDIWGRYDFWGRPHPEVQQRNAPRLTAALRDLTALLGAPPEPGEPTYFGMATVDGVAEPEADENGWGPDVSGWL